MSLPLGPDHLAEIKVSLSTVNNQDGAAIVIQAFHRIFEQRPDLRPVFPNDIASHAGKVWSGITLLVSVIDHEDESNRVLKELAESHFAYGAKAPHYRIVTEELHKAMLDHAGVDRTDRLSESLQILFAHVTKEMLQRRE